MNRRQKIIVSVTGIFLVLLLLVGLTYAYFLTKINGNENTKSISVTTANLALVYGDGNGIISAEKIQPGTTLDKKEFTVKNEGNAETDYVVVIEDVKVTYASTVEVDGETHTAGSKTTFESNDFIYTLTCTEGCNGVDTETTFPMTGGILVGNSIEVGVTHTYELTVTYKETGLDQSNDMNKSLDAKVNIADISSINPYSDNTSSLAYNIINNAIGLTAEEKTNGYAELLETPLTQPAHATSLENESILTYTMDDYGTSYYFRGNVVDNYVNYAGMCWRIVRIEGDGSVKLILEDRNEQCNDKEGQDLNNNGTYFTGNWNSGEEDYYLFGYDNNRADFLNYTGGLADSFKTFQTTLAKKIDSSIGDMPTNEQVNNTLSNKLKVDEWCYDDKVTVTQSYGYDADWKDTEIKDDAVNGWFTDEYYGAYTRIYTNEKPSLNCSGTKLTKFRDGTDMYVGTLTVDEMSFAGGIGKTANENYYLMNTYVKQQAEENNHLYWWSLSLMSFEEELGYTDSVFILDSDGRLTSGYDFVDIVYSRPAVSLKSGSVIVGGEGTIDSPYIID